MNIVKDAYTTQEMAVSLGITRQAVEQRAKAENWDSRPRKGRGGGVEWLINEKMSDATRARVASSLIMQEASAQAVALHRPSLCSLADVPAVQGDGVRRNPNGNLIHMTDLSPFTQKQRDAALARLTFVREVGRLEVLVGKEEAVQRLVDASRQGTLAAHLQELVPLANAKIGMGNRGLSRRRLYAWCTAYLKGGDAALVPQKREKDMSIPPWAALFMKYYQQPQKPSLRLAYRDFLAEYITLSSALPPSYDTARRFLKKMGTPEAAWGRNTGNALLKFKVHKRRTTKDLFPGDVYTADGTTFDAEVQHPHSGRPCKPEVTAMVDVATRRIVGMSLGQAESAIAVLDALRMACLFGGIPALLYTDNGPGYKNNMLGYRGQGMLSRLGIELTNSIPGRPQGKGLMERAVQTICTDAAKRLPSCTHKDMDGDTAKKVYKLTRADIKRAGKSPLLPTWDDFKDAMLARVEEYNSTPHRSLPKIVDETGRRRHMTPDEMWQRFLDQNIWEPHYPSEAERDDLFMPHEMRKTNNGEVQFYGIYYNADLELFHGEFVEVRYDLWDASEVQIYHPKGGKICTAKLGGNEIPYFPQSRIEAARENRAKAQAKRLAAQLQAVMPGARVELPEAEPVFTVADVLQGQATPERELVPVGGTVAEAGREALTITPDAPTRRPIFVSQQEKYEWLHRNPGACTEGDEAWLQQYADTEEYEHLREYYEFRGLGWNAEAAQSM